MKWPWSSSLKEKCKKKSKDDTAGKSEKKMYDHY